MRKHFYIHINFYSSVNANVSKCSLYTFYNNPAPLNGSTQFHYCTDSNPGTGADDAFILKRGVWRNATWPSNSRPAIAASASHFQIRFLPEYFDRLHAWVIVLFYVPPLHQVTTLALREQDERSDPRPQQVE